VCCLASRRGRPYEKIAPVAYVIEGLRQDLQAEHIPITSLTECRAETVQRILEMGRRMGFEM
jgi:hypothetical protein